MDKMLINSLLHKYLEQPQWISESGVQERSANKVRNVT